MQTMQCQLKNKVFFIFCRGGSRTALSRTALPVLFRVGPLGFFLICDVSFVIIEAVNQPKIGLSFPRKRESSIVGILDSASSAE